MRRSMLIMAPILVIVATALGWLLAGIGDAIVTFVLGVLAMCFAMWLARDYDFRPYGSSGKDPPPHKRGD